MQKQNSEKSSLWKEILGVLSSIVPMAVYYKKKMSSKQSFNKFNKVKL